MFFEIKYCYRLRRLRIALSNQVTKRKRIPFGTTSGTMRCRSQTIAHNAKYMRSGKFPSRSSTRIRPMRRVGVRDPRLPQARYRRDPLHFEHHCFPTRREARRDPSRRRCRCHRGCTGQRMHWTGKPRLAGPVRFVSGAFRKANVSSRSEMNCFVAPSIRSITAVPIRSWSAPAGWSRGQLEGRHNLDLRAPPATSSCVSILLA